VKKQTTTVFMLLTLRGIGPLSLAAGGGEILSRGSYPFGTDSVPIWLDNLSCSGTETSLFDCPANDIGDSNCNHNEDVGVQCTGGG
jgi:hypothetical protein